MSASPYIESIELTSGFLPGVRLDLSPGLNIIIGENGSGKTTVIESARFALGFPVPDHRAKSVSDQLRATLPIGRAIVRARTVHGTLFEASRARGDDEPRVTSEGAPFTLSDDVFRAELYGPGEVGHIALSPASQLALIDKFARAEHREIDEAIARVERDLGENADQLKRFADEIDDDEARVAELPSVERALSAIGEASGLDVAARERASSEKNIADMMGAADAAQSALEASLQRAFPADLDPAILAGPNGASFADVRAVLREARATRSAARRPKSGDGWKAGAITS